MKSLLIVKFNEAFFATKGLEKKNGCCLFLLKQREVNTFFATKHPQKKNNILSSSSPQTEKRKEENDDNYNRCRFLRNRIPKEEDDGTMY